MTPAWADTLGRTILGAALIVAALAAWMPGCSVDGPPPWPLDINHCFLRCSDSAVCTPDAAHACAGPMDRDSCGARLGCRWGAEAVELDRVEATVNGDPVRLCIASDGFFPCVRPVGEE